MPPRPDAFVDLVAVVDLTVASPLLLMVGASAPAAGERPRNGRRGYRPVGAATTLRRGHGVVAVGSVVGGRLGAVGRVDRRNTASSIALAIGPARRPPVPAEISALVPFSITATAYLGCSAGAKAMIQACDRSGSPGPLSWAVPVLAATRDAAVEGDAAAGGAALGDADHQLAFDVGGLAADRALPHLGLGALDHAAVVVERRRRRRTASSSRRRWRPWRPPSPCGAAPSGRRSGRSPGSPAAAGSGRCRLKSPIVLAAARGRSIGIVSPTPQRAMPSWKRSGAELDRGAGERGVARAGEHLARSPPHTLAGVVLDRVGGLRRHVAAFVGRRCCRG